VHNVGERHGRKETRGKDCALGGVWDLWVKLRNGAEGIKLI
jgi:hypothetical protein